MESFFALLQKNVLDRRTWATRQELRIAIVTWIEHTYHRRRRQKRLAPLTPLSPDHAAVPGAPGLVAENPARVFVAIWPTGCAGCAAACRASRCAAPRVAFWPCMGGPFGAHGTLCAGQEVGGNAWSSSTAAEGVRRPEPDVRGGGQVGRDSEVRWLRTDRWTR